MRERTPYEAVRGDALHSAWRKVRENGLKSLSAETQDAIRKFDASSLQRLRRIDRQLRLEQFEFIPQKGVLKKRAGKKPRPLVVAAIQNRIVQRAILDVLQGIPAIRAVFENPFSFGGIKERGRQHAIAAAVNRIQAGDRFYVRSDIQDFFTKIPRPRVLDFLALHIHDDKLLSLVGRAVETNLANLEQLGEEAERFPLTEEGVAQGSALSPLMGNIFLANFDRTMNGRGITCLRYIDDFILLGPDSAKVGKSFQSAQAKLAAFGMQAYDPVKDSKKAQMGETAKGFDFLGCRISPGLVHPSIGARRRLFALIDEALTAGRRAMLIAARYPDRAPPKRRFVQALVRVDNILLGWGHAFAFCNGRQLFEDLDKKITQDLIKFLQVAQSLMKGSEQTFRRVLGVQLLSDTPQVAL